LRLDRRIWEAHGKLGGRFCPRSAGFLLWCTMPPVMVSMRKELHGQPLRKIAADLAARGHLTAYGKPTFQRTGGRLRGDQFARA
jgi:hypothetical protein